VTGARATLIGILLGSATAAAQPAGVRLQGFLTDTGGDPVTDTIDLIVKLYPTASGGAELWTETFADVDIVAGSFAVELGLDEADLVQDDLWLGIAIASAGQELPRMRVASVPFALLGSDAAQIGGIDASAYQRRILGCLPDQAIESINADGTVLCANDDAMGVGGVSGGLGMVESGYPNVTLAVAPGEGLATFGDSLVVDFDANGALDLISRLDHDHPGLFLPAGADMSCSPPQKITGIDSVTGDVLCAPDVFVSYTGSNGMVVTPDGSGLYDQLLDTGTSLTVGGVTSGAYYIAPTHVHSVSLYATDFKPTSSGFIDYLAAPAQGGRLTAPGLVNLIAGLQLPQGAYNPWFWWSYEIADPSVDSILCEFRYNRMDGTNDNGWWSGYGVAGGVLISGGGAGGFSFVDNTQYVYYARCEINDQPPVGDVRLIGYRLEYEYNLMGR